MRIKYLTAIGITSIMLLGIGFNDIAAAKCEDNKKVLKAAKNIIENPNQKNIDCYINILKRRAIIHSIKRDCEALADDYRSILYFLRKDKNSAEYLKYAKKLNNANTALGFKNTQNERLEIAKTLYLEEKYFASAYEFLELAQEEYSKEICYEYLGDISQKFNNPKSAIIFYKKGLLIEPENYNLTYKTGKIYKDLKKYDEAKEFFEKTIELTEDPDIINCIIKSYENELAENSDNESVYEVLGLAYQKIKEYKKTYELFTKAINLSPEDIFLKYYLGNLLFDMGEYAQAINIYNSIIASNPYETQIRIARAKCYRATGNINTAMKDYQVVLALYPNSKQAQYGMVQLFSGKKSIDEIIKLFYPLNKKFVPNADFYNNLASILYQKNMVKDAIYVYKKSVKIAPKAARAYIQLYKIYELEGQNANAYEIIKQAYINMPKNLEIRNIYTAANKSALSNKSSLALSYMANKEYHKAIKIYNQINPKDASVYESLANCYKSMKNHKAAIDNLAKAIKLDPVNSDLYYNTALLYLDLNSKKTAENYLEKAIGLDKKNLKARKLLSYLKQQEVDESLNKAYNLFQKKKYKETIVELNKSEKLYPNNPNVYFYKGLTYKALNDLNNSYKNFAHTLQMDRSYYTAHFYMAEILEKQGKEKQALEEYERFLGADVQDEAKRKKAENKVIELGKKYY